MDEDEGSDSTGDAIDDFIRMRTGIRSEDYLNLRFPIENATEEQVLEQLQTVMREYTFGGEPLRRNGHYIATVELNLKRTQSTLINGYFVYDVSFDVTDSNMAAWNHEEEYFLFFKKPSRTTLTQFSPDYRKGEQFVPALVTNWEFTEKYPFNRGLIAEGSGRWSTVFSPTINLVAQAIGLDRLPSYRLYKED